MENGRTLTIVFDLPLKLKFSFFSSEIQDLVVERTQDTTLSRLYHHLEESLRISYKETLSLLPIAVCKSNDTAEFTRLPLVTEHIWRHLVDKYPYDITKVVLERRPSIDLTAPICVSLLRRELKFLDLSYYFPPKLEREHLVSLGESVLYEDLHIKPKLRRGIWMHILGVFHPALKTLEQREAYIEDLRRVYDSLKGKLSNDVVWTPQIQHLRESIQRDAVRTDPSERFLALSVNMQKLVEIVTVYTLEHSEIKYTQGMTDLLSPILYVMEREDDAYICFAAMFERIKVNFTEWCEGTLNKLERLKHLCEVLDPELYAQLTLQQTEDPFVLFFGMVLIECRREFNFQDGLHLLEVLWSAAIHKDSPSLEEVSPAKWASYMTSVSQDIISQTFGEIGAPYSTHPLDDEDTADVIMSPSSRSSSRRSQSSARLIPRPGSASTRSGETQSLHNNMDEQQSVNDSPTLTTGNDSPPPPPPHLSATKKATSLPENGYVLVSSTTNGTSSSTEVKSEGDLCTGEYEECVDSLGELTCLPHTTEMADMSSVSSGRSKINGQSISDSPLVQIKEDETANGSVNESEVFLYGCLELESKKETVGPLPNASTSPEPDWSEEAAVKVGTYPRLKRKDEGREELKRSTLPRSHSAIPPVPFLHNISRPSLSSPYVSSIRALDPNFSYPDKNLDPFIDDSSSSSPVPPSSPNRLSPFSTSPASSRLSPFFEAMERVSNRAQSLEASVEVSHIISELMSVEQTHPNVNRETSLRIRMADAFSLFVCLAILVKNRSAIMADQMDFVGLSVLLNSQAENQSLPHILKLARQLHKVYHSYQKIYFNSHTEKDARMFETWLDDPSVITIGDRIN